MSDSMKITTAPYRERYTACASCRAAATLLLTVVDGDTGVHVGGDTTTCQRHRQTWERRLAAQFEISSNPEDQKAGAR